MIAGIAQEESVSEDCAIDVPVLRRAVMDYLARREHSRHELVLKLTRKFPDAAPVEFDVVLDQLSREGLQSDERFVESYVRYRRGKGFGPFHIRAALQQRGVADTIVSRFLFEDDDSWDDIARGLIGNRFGSLSSAIEFGSKLHQRIHRLLQSRGFSPHTIRKIIDPLL